MSDELSSSEEAKHTKKLKTSKKKYVHKFRTEWLANPDYSPWLSSSLKGNTYFNCKLCKSDYLGGISAVQKHFSSEKHKVIEKSIKNTIKINNVAAYNNAPNLTKETKIAEIRLAMFISEHSIALRTSDHLVSLFKSICLESNVVKNLTCNRSKMTALTNNVIGKYKFENLIERMKTQSFSIMIDESTDKSSTKHLAVVSRMVQNSNFEIRDEFVKLIEVSDASAKGVYDAIINFFNTHAILYKQNLAGFASDGANVMFGNKHSIKSLLEQYVPHLFVIKCLCHSLALCASYACEKLPNDVENLIHEVYNYMKFSSKRQKNFQEFQEFLDMKPYKLLQPSQTRWLAFQACVKRMVDLYKSIKLYFQAEHLLDNKATNIYHKLSNPVNELYLHFLNFILPILTNLNIEFQSQKLKIHCIYSNIERTFKTILECYLKYDYIKNTATPHIQYRNPEHFLPLNEIYLEAHCMAELSKNVLSKQNKEIF